MACIQGFFTKLPPVHYYKSVQLLVRLFQLLLPKVLAVGGVCCLQEPVNRTRHLVFYPVSHTLRQVSEIFSRMRL